MKIVGVLFAGLFLWCAWLQQNDPDPQNWILIYVGAALACLRPTPMFSGTLVLFAGVWAFRIYEQLDLGVPLTEALSDWQMHAQGSEDVREIGGLLLVVVVVTALAVARRVAR